MQNLGIREAAHKAGLLGAPVAIFLLGIASSVSAQTSNSADAPSEAARRAAASPYRFILQSATAPRKPAAPAPAAAPAPVAEKKAAAAPVQQASVQPSATQQASAPVVAPAPAPAPAAPEPAVASLSRQATEPPPVRREIVPIRTDEPRLSPALLREEPHGTVKIHFDINYDGSVGDVKVISSSNRALNKPTVEAVQGWKFQPVDEVLTVETEVVYNFDKDK